MVCPHFVAYFCLLLNVIESANVSHDVLHQNQADHIQRTRLYGNINVFAYYFAEILVGTPPQRISVIVDTGSGLCAFPCVGCSHCGTHLDLPFDTAASNTSQVLSCMPGCDLCHGGKCGYVEQYTEGSKIEGIWFRDLVMLDGSDKDNKPVYASLGCHIMEEDLFYTQKVNGILGLAPHKITGKSNVLEDLFRDKTQVFSFCLAEWGGLWTVGGYDKSFLLPGVGLQWTSLHHIGYFGLTLDQIRCGYQIVGTAIDIGTTILDTGTTFSYLSHPVYVALMAALTTQCIGTNCGASPVPHSDQTCWKLISGTTPNQFPNMSLVMSDGSTFVWRPDAYMFRRYDKADEWCFGFAGSKTTHTTVLGTSFFLHKTIVFDMSQSMLGFADSACPENHYTRPKAEAGQSLVAQISPRTFAAAQDQDDVLGRIHMVFLSLGAIGLFLLLVASVMRLRACVKGEEDEDDESQVQLADKSGSEA